MADLQGGATYSTALLEHCAKALWERTTGKSYREMFPWNSDLPEARATRGRAVERASAVLQAAAAYVGDPAEYSDTEPEPTAPPTIYDRDGQVVDWGGSHG